MNNHFFMYQNLIFIFVIKYTFPAIIPNNFWISNSYFNFGENILYLNMKAAKMFPINPPFAKKNTKKIQKSNFFFTNYEHRFETKTTDFISLKSKS